MTNPALFFFLSTLLVAACFAVIILRNPLYSVLSLVFAIFALSTLFITLEAYFVSIILMLVYAGAVLVFFLFVVMCLNIQPQALTSDTRYRYQWLGASLIMVVFTQITLVIKSAFQCSQLAPSTIQGTIEHVGRILFTDYLLPFEITSFLLLIAVFGIVALAQDVLQTK